MMDERRNINMVDQEWRVRVDKTLADQNTMLSSIDSELKQHITFAKERFERVEPVVEALDGMKSGIKVIGWIGSKASALAAFFAATVTAFFVWKDHWK
jgi:hypothetical protein